MKITDELTESAVLAELGTRLARHRIDTGLTQAGLAERAGVAKRTVERIEGGHAAELTTLVRLLRALALGGGLEGLVPEPPPSPMALLKARGRERQRVSRHSATASARRDWSWAE